jgi:hypothetical protein
MARHEEAERIYRGVGNQFGLLRSLGYQAVILIAREDYERALAVYREEESLCREMRKWEGLVKALTSQAALLLRKREKVQALVASNEAYRLASEHGLTDLARQAQKIRESAR